MAWQDSDITGGKVRLKNSPVAGESIGAAGLVPGEVALNSADGKMLFRKPDGTVGFVSGIIDPPSDSIIYGRRNAAWVDISGPSNLQVRRGTQAEVAAITPLSGEPVWEETNKILYLGDGTTAGGIPTAYPVKSSVVLTTGNLADTSSAAGRTPLTLSPINSVWEFTWISHLGGGDYAENGQMAFYANKTGLGDLLGNFLFINSGGSATHARLSSSPVTCAVGGNNEFMRASGIVKVTSASGTLDFIVVASDIASQGSAAQACIARRIS